MKYITKYRTRSFDLNLRNELKLTELDQYLQESADRQIAETDMAYDDIVRIRRKAFVLSRMSIEIYSSIDRCCEVEGQTWVSEGRAANFPRNYELYSKDKLIARGYSNWALVDVDTKKLMRYGDYDMSSYPHDEPLELSIPTRFRIPKDLELKHVGDYHVGYSLSDINGHMNNTRYLNVLADFIPEVENKSFTSVNIRYAHEAPYQGDVEVHMSEPVSPEGIDPRADKIVYVKTLVEGELNVEVIFGYREV